ncbi:MAG TPA: hypothetical protein VI685_21050 [Candidatus Angelobacter sp.]
MPVILKIDSRRRVVYSTFYGKVADGELIRHGHTIASDPDFRRDFNEIVDFSEVTELSISDSTLATIAGMPSLYNASVRHIIIAPAKEASQIAKRFKALARKSRRNLFAVRTRTQAYKLLGLD